MRRERDCLKVFRNKVTEASLLDGQQLDAVDKEVAAEIDAAVKAARLAAMPEASQVVTDVYVRYP